MLRTMVRDVVLGLHITFGVIALVLGPLALVAATAGDPRAARLANAYFGAVLGVCGAAGLLVALAPSRLWWLAPIAVGTGSLAVLGRRASGRRGPRWVGACVHGQGGSYVALVIAGLVVSVGSPLAWVAPTLVGLPVISHVIRRILAEQAATSSLASPSLPDA